MADVIDIPSGTTDNTVALMMQSPAFQQVLRQVEQTARDAVIEETKRNAVTLFLFAVAGGAVGGMLFRGVAGAVTAAGIVVLAGSRLLSAKATPPVADTTPVVSGLGRVHTQPAVHGFSVRG